MTGSIPEQQRRGRRLSANGLAAMVTEPSARGIADELGQLICSGALAQGLQLPSVRALAAALHVGPTTVASAWARLQQRELIHTDRRNGSFVRGAGALAGRRFLTVPTASDVRLDLSTALPDPALLPDLSAAVARAATSVSWREYPEHPTDATLREVVAETWPFGADDLTFTNGGHDAIARVAQVVLRPHDRVLVEHVTAASLLDIMDEHQAEVVPVECDDDGPLPAAVEAAMRTHPKMLLLQPRMASPLGHALSVARARALATVVREHDILALEDDVAPMLAPTSAVSLGQFVPRQTLLVRSWNKSHGPHLRVGALGGNRQVVARVRAWQELTGSWPSGLTQRTLAYLLTDARAQRAVMLARDRYLQRRQHLVSALHDQGLAPTGVGGLSVWVHVHNAAEAIGALAQHDIGIASGAPFTPDGEGESHVRIATTLPHDRHALIAHELGRAHRRSTPDCAPSSRRVRSLGATARRQVSAT